MPQELPQNAFVTDEEIERCTEIIESLIADRGRLSDLDEVRRRALLIAAGRLSRPTRDEMERAGKAFRKTVRKREVEADREVRAQSEIRMTRTATVFAPPPKMITAGAPAGAPANEPVRELKQPRNCYVCKQEFTKLHFFYDALCIPCAEFNYEKRFQSVTLEGRVAMITGARVKIGFYAALMMLRAGAKVIVTTRFPRDAAERFAREDDFGQWKHRLEVYGLDLRHSPSVEIFARYLEQTNDRLDILINNAAQTVRRPAAFYEHMVAGETAPWDSLSADVQGVLRSYEACRDAVRHAHLSAESASPGLSLAHATGLSSFHAAETGVGLLHPAELSQLPCAYDDIQAAPALFPKGQSDADLQQIDLRSMNSWRMTLGDVPAPEMLEVQLVNAVAPFILVSKLKPLMMKKPTGDRHIVNVSAMEGQFTRYTKTDRHPHTNMAKAALNMMTHTSAPDYASSGIFMNAVDTGWVTDEDPAAFAQRKQEVHDFQPPLDIVDGAARICDPFIHGLLTGEHVWGQFLKNYKPTTW
jgi:NAD(P)-dependent dehydrogenase (short-subunit alcohol dehydrogenase family)